jgi:hypothetical protein
MGTRRALSGTVAEALVRAVPDLAAARIVEDSRVKFLVLAYGAEADWLALSKQEQEALLAQDQVLRDRGDTVAAVADNGLVVRAWDGTPSTSAAPFANSAVPLAGFGIIEAESIEEVVRLVADTACARAGGAVEIREITAGNL